MEVYGPESSGKTTLCYHVASSAQRNGGVVAFIDAEHALDPGYAKNVGVDVDELLAWCREEMANYKVPRSVVVVDALPLNASGKVLKYELRNRG